MAHTWSLHLGSFLFDERDVWDITSFAIRDYVRDKSTLDVRRMRR